MMEWLKEQIVKYITGSIRYDRNDEHYDYYLMNYMAGSKVSYHSYALSWGYKEVSNGIYHNDVLFGPGKKFVQYHDGCYTYSRGVYKNNMLCGKGEVEVSPPIYHERMEHYPKSGNDDDDECSTVTYRGMFRKDRLHGEGSITSPYFTVSGTFKDGRFVKGVLRIRKYKSGLMSPSYRGVKSMKGTFSRPYHTNNTKHLWYLPFIGLTKGTIHYSPHPLDSNNHRILSTTGTYVHGTSLHGANGTIRYKHGGVLKGSFKVGRIDGVGVFSYPNGMYLRGTFKENRMTQRHAVQLSNGITIETRPSVTVNDVPNKKNGVLKCNLHEKTAKVTFTNGDVFTCNYFMNGESNLVTSELCYSDRYMCQTSGNVSDKVFDGYLYGEESELDLLLTRGVYNCTYAVSESIPNMGKVEFRYWLYARDPELFDVIRKSNLYMYIDGSMYESFKTPEDFHLPNVNVNVLEKLLALKNTECENDCSEGVVHISAKIVNE